MPVKLDTYNSQNYAGTLGSGLLHRLFSRPVIHLWLQAINLCSIGDCYRPAPLYHINLLCNNQSKTDKMLLAYAQGFF